jgi:hypothetical protein
MFILGLWFLSLLGTFERLQHHKGAAITDAVHIFILGLWFLSLPGIFKRLQYHKGILRQTKRYK